MVCNTTRLVLPRFWNVVTGLDGTAKRPAGSRPGGASLREGYEAAKARSSTDTG
jgi:hypothetical protein